MGTRPHFSFFIFSLFYAFASITGTICFFLETTPGSKAILSSKDTLKPFSIISVLFPNAIILELLFKISVIAKINKSILFFSIKEFMANSMSALFFKTSSKSTVFTCAICIFVLFALNSFESILIKSFAEYELN